MSDGRRDSIDPNVPKGNPPADYVTTTEAVRFPGILAELIQSGVQVLVTKNSFVLGGFYKSGDIQLRRLAGDRTSYTAFDRYDCETTINELRDLVEMNFDWWQRSKKRGNPGWEQPNEMWIPLLVKFGFVAKQTVDVYTELPQT